MRALMTRNEFLRRFYLQPAPKVSWRGPLWDDIQLHQSAVLVALQERNHGLDLILTRRPAHMRFHAHQICFAGGRQDPNDACLQATALREAEEELGLKEHQVELIAPLPTQPVLTRFMIHPYLAFIDPNVQLVPDPNEVQEVIRAPLHRALDHSSHFTQKVERLLYHELVFIPMDGQVIWGATAAIIRRLADHIYPQRRALYRPVR